MNSHAVENRGLEQFQSYTAEEKRVMEECRRESFYYRGLPCSFMAMALYHYATQKGYLKGGRTTTAHFIKISFVGLAGMILGRLSYLPKCAEKLMQLPGSEERRRRRGLAFREGFREPSHYYSETAPAEGPGHRDSTGGRPYSSPITLDTDRNIRNEGLDDIERPSLDRDVHLPQEMDPGGSKVRTTYEELRRQNREEYLKKHQTAQPTTPHLGGVGILAQEMDQERTKMDTKGRNGEESERRSSFRPGENQKNKYGDTWEN